MRRRKRIAAFFLVCLVLVMVAAVAGSLTIPSVMDIYGCQEMFSQYVVDPDVARQNVPSKWNVKIQDNGQALLLVMVQECEKVVLDKVVNVGAVGMSHIWIELEGPDEMVTPLPGTTRSLATRYWYIVPHQFDNSLARTLIALMGIDTQLVQEVSVGGDPGGTRSGQVIEGASPGANYDWTETSALYPAADVVTGSQRFYRSYGVRESTAVAKCESHFLGDAQVSLNAEPGSQVGQLGFGATLTGFSNPVWVEHCRVDYRVQLFPRD